MKLDKYLEALQNCPDEQLKDELGIYDNWPIFMNADFDFVVEHLKQSEIYRYKKAIEEAGKMKHLFDYAPGTVNLQVFDSIPSFFCIGSKEDRQRQKRDYNMTIMLHTYQDRKIENVHESRALARVVNDVGQFAIKRNIPICMPAAIGWKYLDDKDYSRIVYHQLEMFVTS